MQQTPRAIVVKCDGSVYDVDVDVEAITMNLEHSGLIHVVCNIGHRFRYTKFFIVK